VKQSPPDHLAGLPAQRRFDEREKALLAPYVTSTDGPVFVLTNLPEVIKGALFSRYSRSALGLRELLLKEFIDDPESAFKEIAGSPEETASGAQGAAATAADRYLAVEKAQGFYDRILDGYGDDSIGELGGAHLALEDVSMIATKVLEDARIGGSPLEKSTRYVSFAEPRQGEFLFYKEPTLLASPHRQRYLDTCRRLFETYRDLQEPLINFITGEVPRPENISEGAWKRSVRARALDALRGLLPAATLTNMGIFANGRFFETLLAGLRRQALSELQAIGGAARNELHKVIPSFIRRADPEHPHFDGFTGYENRLREHVASLAGRLAASGGEPPGAAERREVELIWHDPDAGRKVLAALAYPDHSGPLGLLQDSLLRMAPDERQEVFSKLGQARTNRRHKPPRAFELAFFSFDLLGDFGMYRDMHRHRMLTQQRQMLSTRHGFVTPEELPLAGLEGPYREVMEQAAETYEAIAADFPLQAQYVVPMAYRIRWHMHINLRALIWLVELRSSPQGHPAYRKMAQQMYHRVAEALPEFAPLFGFVDLEDYPLGRLGAEQRSEDKRSGK